MLWLLFSILKRWSARCRCINIGAPDEPYLTRWYLIPRNRWLNIYLHQFHRSDDDRAMHDHPWWSVSLMLDGACVEHDQSGFRAIKAGMLRVRSAEYRHRIELVGSPCWTLFITGPRISVFVHPDTQPVADRVPEANKNA